MVVAIILYLLLNMYAATSGVKDAVLWSKRGTEAYKWNEHFIFVIERILICICCIPALYLSQIHLVLVLAAFILSFSFWHNGFYYLGRNGIDKNVYPLRFWDESTTSSSVLEFSTRERSIMKVVSIAILILISIL